MQDTSVAMANFDGMYDMHGGADELVYPHHESHLVQLRAISGKQESVRLWTHTGLVYIGGKKMSKSLGNTIMVKDLLQRHGANALRLYLLSRHYRDRLDFDEKDIAAFEELDGTIAERIGGTKERPMLKEFLRCMDDDFDTFSALKIIRAAAKSESKDLKILASILGL